MNTLEKDLADIAKGWNCKFPITMRASAMRDAIEAGNIELAEKYAEEIETIHKKFQERCGLAPLFKPLPNTDVWKLSLERWANILIRAHMCTRYMQVFPGSSRAQVLVNWQRVHGVSRTKSCVVHMRDLIPVPKEKAEA